MTITNHPTAPVRSTWMTQVRTSLAERREAKAARRALEAELSSYRTPAEVEDLFAALRSQDDNPTAEDMRRILLDNLQSYESIRAAA